MKFVQPLATAISAEWRACGYAPPDFPLIAARHISGPLAFGEADVIDAIAGTDHVPPQRRMDAGFGQPAVTVYSDELFEIEVLFWHTATPAIHQHAFSGAFTLLAGRSVHARYSFRAEASYEGLTTGALARTDLEVLHPGRAICITQGPELIHSVSHIDNPSLSMVVRTHQNVAPEMTYLPPGLSYDPSGRSTHLHKQLQLLDMMSITRHPDYDVVASRIMKNSPVFDLLSCAFRIGYHDLGPERLSAYDGILEGRLAGFSGTRIVLEAVREDRRRTQLVALRKLLTDPNDRLVLALTLSCTDPEAVMTDATRYTGDEKTAVELIATSTAKLFADGQQREILARCVIANRLAGGSEHDLHHSIARTTGTAISDETRAKIRDINLSLRQHPLLRAVLR